ncbi:MAG: ABC transporter substrate-binding protein/permease [Bifidobacteriaceae bacterium]|jgi:putative lysine transport system permease protein|nr:ABC transporter substrate-binding protein/permease [Bifidobacteriaceae bacterium]
MNKISIWLVALFLCATNLIQFTPTILHAKSNNLTVGMECNYTPFNWQTNTKTDTSVKIGGAGYCDGYDVQIATIIAEKLDRKLQIKKIGWDGLQPALNSGEIDLIIAGMTKTTERENGIDFTTEYYSSDVVLVGKSDVIINNQSLKDGDFDSIQDFAGQNIIAQKNTTYDDVVDQINNVNHITPRGSYPELVYAVEQGDAIALVAEMPVAKKITLTNPDFTIINFDEGKSFDLDTSVSIGVKKGSKDGSLGQDSKQFYEDVQNALDEISQDQRNQIMESAVGNAPAEENPEESNAENPDQNTNQNNAEDSLKPQADTPLPENFFARIGAIAQRNSSLFLYGSGVTVLLALTGTIVGLFFGLILCLIKNTKVRKNDPILKTITKHILKFISSFYIFIFRGTPMMVQAIFLYYMLRPLIHWSALEAGIIIISLNTGAYMAEIIRSGLQSIDQGQREAGLSLGVSETKVFRFIMLPQAIRNSFPSIGNQFVVNIKDSCVLNVIGVIDLYFQSSSVAGTNMLYAETFIVTCLIYLSLTFLAGLLLSFIERKITLDPTKKTSASDYVG